MQWENSAVMLYWLQRASETQNQQAAQVSFALTLTAWHTSLSTPWLVCYTWDQAAGHSVINLHLLLEAALLVLWAADYLQVNRCGLTSQGLFCRCGRSLALAGRRDSGHITENKWTKGLQRGKRESQSSSEVCNVLLFFTHDHKNSTVSVFFISELIKNMKLSDYESVWGTKTANKQANTSHYRQQLLWKCDVFIIPISFASLFIIYFFFLNFLKFSLF